MWDEQYPRIEEDKPCDESSNQRADVEVIAQAKNLALTPSLKFSSESKSFLKQCRDQFVLKKFSYSQAQ